eukprot:Seg5619.1 transcript_id=Seg5619.1/GoldUCD/mRNA.D3Y31 product="hypothetical protein" protein_id=Seg5619.1/GoldUCD/D3Y31
MMSKSIFALGLIAIIMATLVSGHEQLTAAEKKHIACVKGAQTSYSECRANCRKMKVELEHQGSCFKDCKFFLKDDFEICKAEKEAAESA